MMRRALVIVFFMLIAPWASAGPVRTPDDILMDLMRQAMREPDHFAEHFESDVWLHDMSQRLKPMMPNEEERIRFLRLLHREAMRTKLSPEFVLSVIEVESRFNQFAISSAGAMGYMQVMPFWLKVIGKPGDSLVDPKTNLRMGCTILRHYLDMERGDLVRGLARYNGSLGRVEYPALVVRAMNRRWEP